MEYDFGKVVQIQKVIAKARNDANYDTNFRNVEVRVSNTSSPTGDFSSAALLAQYTSTAAKGEVVPFEGSNPVWGRYVSIKCTDTGYFQIANVNILGKE